MPHQKSHPAVRSTVGQDILVALSAGEIGTGDGPLIIAVCHCSSKVCEPGSLGSCASPLKGADLQRVIASAREALQFQEDVASAPFGVRNQPGGDLLLLSFKGVFYAIRRRMKAGLFTLL